MGAIPRKPVATGLRAGGVFSDKSTGSTRQRRRAYRFFTVRPRENVKAFENHARRSGHDIN